MFMNDIYYKEPKQILDEIFCLIDDTPSHITTMYNVMNECNNYKSYFILCLIYKDILFGKSLISSGINILPNLDNYDNQDVAKIFGYTFISIKEIKSIFNYNDTEIRTALKKLELNNYIRSIYLSKKLKLFEITDKGYAVFHNEHHQ